MVREHACGQITSGRIICSSAASWISELVTGTGLSQQGGSWVNIVKAENAYEEFAGEVMHLVTITVPGVPLATQEEFAAEAFLRVYRSPNVGYHCINREPKTLAEAQELVDAYEHNYRATVGQAEQTKGRARRVCFADEHHNSSDEEDSTARQIRTPRGTHIGDALQTILGQLQQLREQQQGVASNGQGRARTHNPVGAFRTNCLPSPGGACYSPTRPMKECFACVEAGHFKKKCPCSPSPLSQGPAIEKRLWVRQTGQNLTPIIDEGQPPGNNFHQQHEKPDTEVHTHARNLPMLPAKQTSPSNILAVIIGQQTTWGPMLMMSVTINGVPAEATVDTGIEVTVIPETFFRGLVKGSLEDQGGPDRLLNAEDGFKMVARSGIHVTFVLGPGTINQSMESDFHSAGIPA